ncbi:MAG: Fpg/Nei family DNA glycosylase [Spirochaetota bacterium]
MPELPDVEVFRRYLDSTSLHRRIDGVEITSSRLLRGVSQRQLGKALEGRTFVEGRRHGKHLFAKIEGEDRYLLLHFGMTGFLSYYKGDEDPEYSYLVLRFTEGYSLAYVNKRMLGRVGLIEDIPAYVEEEGLGPDAMDVSREAFGSIVEGGRGSVKSTLMNQKRICGLGNVYTDEILFDAGVHPNRNCSELSEAEIDTLFASMNTVVDTAIDAKAQPEKMPQSFLLPRRAEGASCPRCGGSVNKITISGRSTYFCPSCQK